jgi:hypothetical protein
MAEDSEFAIADLIGDELEGRCTTAISAGGGRLCLKPCEKRFQGGDWQWVILISDRIR